MKSQNLDTLIKILYQERRVLLRSLRLNSKDETIIQKLSIVEKEIDEMEMIEREIRYSPEEALLNLHRKDI